MAEPSSLIASRPAMFNMGGANRCQHTSHSHCWQHTSARIAQVWSRSCLLFQPRCSGQQCCCLQWLWQGSCCHRCLLGWCRGWAVGDASQDLQQHKERILTLHTMSHVTYGTAGAAGCLVTGLVHWAWQSCLVEPHLLTRRLCLLSRMTA
jgi:hypothetical protein